MALTVPVDPESRKSVLDFFRAHRGLSNARQAQLLGHSIGYVRRLRKRHGLSNPVPEPFKKNAARAREFLAEVHERARERARARKAELIKEGKDKEGKDRARKNLQRAYRRRTLPGAMPEMLIDKETWFQRLLDAGYSPQEAREPFKGKGMPKMIEGAFVARTSKQLGVMLKKQSKEYNWLRDHYATMGLSMRECAKLTGTRIRSVCNGLVKNLIYIDLLREVVHEGTEKIFQEEERLKPSPHYTNQDAISP